MKISQLPPSHYTYIWILQPVPKLPVTCFALHRNLSITGDTGCALTVPANVPWKILTAYSSLKFTAPNWNLELAEVLSRKKLTCNSQVSPGSVQINSVMCSCKTVQHLPLKVYTASGCQIGGEHEWSLKIFQLSFSKLSW